MELTVLLVADHKRNHRENQPKNASDGGGDVVRKNGTGLHFGSENGSHLGDDCFFEVGEDKVLHRQSRSHQCSLCRSFLDYLVPKVPST